MSTSHIKGIAWLAATVGMGIALAVGLPFLASLVPWSAERALGRIASGSFGKVCEAPSDPKSLTAFQKLAKSVFPLSEEDGKLPITIQAIHGTSVNAFASLGGHIYVFDGLLQQAESADEVAGILAHEIEHVRHRHVTEGLIVRLLTVEAFRLVFAGGQTGPELARILLNLRFNRDQEAEADRDGLRRLERGAIDPRGIARFFDRLKDESIVPALLSDHPASGERAAWAKQATWKTLPILTPEEWKAAKAICR